MADEKVSPIHAAKPPVVNPMAPKVSGTAPTLKLKPVIRKPTVGGGVRPGIKLPSAAKPAAPAVTPTAAPTPPPPPATPAAPSEPVTPLNASESTIDKLQLVTQKLKGLTQQIPQQAILHKTGIIAEQALTEAQKQASKARTVRISLSDAIGVAPVKNEATPMKTIRIKRPVDVAGAATPANEPAATGAPADATLTQKKTLKIARPAGGVRPVGKFGAKKPVAAGAKPAGGGDEVADIPDIADIPDMPATTPKFAAPDDTCPPDRIPDVSPAFQFMGLFVQIAACAAMGFLAWKLYQITLTPAWCGGAVMM